MTKEQKALLLDLLSEKQQEVLNDMQMLNDRDMAHDDMYKLESHKLCLIHSTFRTIIETPTK